MKIITVETKYYLLKMHEIKSEHYDYYYVKTENQLLPENAAWMQGYVNHYGGVSLVGSPITDEDKIAELEAELKEALSTDSESREQCYHYDCAQGKHHCLNPVVKAKRCLGVCKDYEPK